MNENKEGRRLTPAERAKRWREAQKREQAQKPRSITSTERSEGRRGKNKKEQEQHPQTVLCAVEQSPQNLCENSVVGAVGMNERKGKRPMTPAERMKRWRAAQKEKQVQKPRAMTSTERSRRHRGKKNGEDAEQYLQPASCVVEQRPRNFCENLVTGPVEKQGKGKTFRDLLFGEFISSSSGRERDTDRRSNEHDRNRTERSVEKQVKGRIFRDPSVRADRTRTERSRRYRTKRKGEKVENRSKMMRLDLFCGDLGEKNIARKTTEKTVEQSGRRETFQALLEGEPDWTLWGDGENEEDQEFVVSGLAVVNDEEREWENVGGSNSSIATRRFHELFTKQEYGYACSVCERLWFRYDLIDVQERHVATLEKIGNVASFRKLCSTCSASLVRGKIPTLATFNGFVYPPKPANLPELNAITTRLISPRVPFMQIRRLRVETGSYKIIGQIINVPVDIQEMVSSLPRDLDDDFAFNVSLKKHIIHKTSAYSGRVCKRDVKVWLNYLESTPLYKLYRIKVDWSRFDSIVNHTEQEELDEVDGENDRELLTAKQQTLVWSEDKYLNIAPGQSKTPLSIIYDEHAEELAFPTIYYGVARKFRSGIRVTPFQIVTSEIRRQDRRGATAEHVLYMAAKIMRLRVASALRTTYRYSGDLENITRGMLEDKGFLEYCIRNNFAFLKSIPNSVEYWISRKKDLFAMMRQLGKPTMFLTMSANEIRWPHLLRILYKLAQGSEEGEYLEDPLALSAARRASLVDEDSVTCCIYFWKLISTIMRLLRSKKDSPFGPYAVVDYFIRTEFQQRGSPHNHVLLWLMNDPRETISEHMPKTVALIEYLCSVNIKDCIKDQRYAMLQYHNHTGTCYKYNKGKKAKSNLCRFNIPFWPSSTTRILLPMTKDNESRNSLRKKGMEIKEKLENNVYENINEFFEHVNLDYDQYLDIIRASISRPTILFKRSMEDIRTNTFNPWIADVLKSNMDLQFILDEYSCASYVVEYINKSDRGLSSLHQQLSDLQDDYPDQSYSDLLKRVSIQMLNAVEMSAQEAAWYLLRQPMSQSSREIMFIPTDVPNKRPVCHKTKARMDEENLSADATNVWTQNIIQKYEARPSLLNNMCLADFVAKMTAARGKKDSAGNQIYYERTVNRVIRWKHFPYDDQMNFKRSMVLLFYPFRNEITELLDGDKYLSLYEQHETEILQLRKQYTWYQDLDECLAKYREAWKDAKDESEDGERFEESYDHQNALIAPQNDDIRLIKFPNSLSAVVKTRSNVMSSEDYCHAIRRTNFEQRALIKHCIARIHDPNTAPVQLFLSGAAGCGKTYVLELLMATYNRFVLTHDDTRNAFIAAASTGKAAVAIRGTTVHTAFSIPTTYRHSGLSWEARQAYRNALASVHIIFIDEISMIGAGMLHIINERLRSITMETEKPFGGMDIIFCGDLRQLPPVCMKPIYEPLRQGFSRSVLWQSLGFYPLQKVMRQSDVVFSGILTKIGDGDNLNPEEQKFIETRFRTREWCEKHIPNVIRLYHKNEDVERYNKSMVSPQWYSIASDTYVGTRDHTQLTSAKTKVHKMKLTATGNLCYCLPLSLNQPYMITCNIDVNDGIVNGAIGFLRHVDFQAKDLESQSENPQELVEEPTCLWIEFQDALHIGKLTRVKCKPLLITRKDLHHNWTPIYKKSVTFEVSKSIKCRRSNFPSTLACALTVHKSQGATFNEVVLDYSRNLSQPLIYVGLSRVKSIDGLFLTNSKNDFKFHHAKATNSPMMIQFRSEMARLENHKFLTLDHQLLQKIEPAKTVLINFNVQSLQAHSLDIITDEVLMRGTIFCFTETRVPNHMSIIMKDLCVVTQNKRPTRQGGVVIDRKKSSSEVKSERQPLLNDSEIGDICHGRIMVENTLSTIIVVYINPGASWTKIREFLLNHMTAQTYKEDLNSPLILCGDFNWDVRDEKKREILLDFMYTQFRLALLNDFTNSTTRNNSCIDLIFTRTLTHFKCETHISYFSHHKPVIIFA